MNPCRNKLFDNVYRAVLWSPGPIGDFHLRNAQAQFITYIYIAMETFQPVHDPRAQISRIARFLYTNLDYFGE